MNILRPKTKINSIFLSYLLNFSKSEIIKLVSGTTVKHIYPSQIITCPLPIVDSESEQKKIASCLSSLDEVIAAHNQKLDALKDYKKGLMQNLFPQEGETVPKYRFKEFLFIKLALLVEPLIPIYRKNFTTILRVNIHFLILVTF